RSYRAPEHIRHLAFRQRADRCGDRPENFFAAHMFPNSPCFPTLPNLSPNPNYAPTMVPDQPSDSRDQDLVPSTPLAGYKTQWAEVAYFLWPNGSTAEGTTLYALYRCEFKVVPDNRFINGRVYS